MRALNADESGIIMDFAAFTREEAMVLERIQHACLTPTKDRALHPNDLMIEHAYEESLELCRSHKGRVTAIVVHDLRHDWCYYHEGFHESKRGKYGHILEVWWSIYRLLANRDITFAAVVSDMPAFEMDRTPLDHPVAEVRRLVVDASFPPERQETSNTNEITQGMEKLRVASPPRPKFTPAFCALRYSRCKNCKNYTTLVNSETICFACFAGLIP
jgi:hypothetical protein